eukprot:gene2552-5471_t
MPRIYLFLLVLLTGSVWINCFARDSQIQHANSHDDDDDDIIDDIQTDKSNNILSNRQHFVKRGIDENQVPILIQPQNSRSRENLQGRILQDDDDRDDDDDNFFGSRKPGRDKSQDKQLKSSVTGKDSVRSFQQRLQNSIDDSAKKIDLNNLQYFGDAHDPLFLSISHSGLALDETGLLSAFRKKRMKLLEEEDVFRESHIAYLRKFVLNHPHQTNSEEQEDNRIVH